MKAEQIKEITEKATEQLVAALQKGHSKTLTNYLKTIGRFHRYSLSNVLLIALQKPHASHVAGFRTWNQLGRFVKKGEKGILILAPIVRRKPENSEDDEKTSSRIAGFRAAYVFDRLSRDLWPSLCALDVIRQCHFRKPLDSSKHIIAQLPCTVQRSLTQRGMQGFQLSTLPTSPGF